MKTSNLVSQLSAELFRAVASNLIATANGANSDSYRNYFRQRDIAYFREGKKAAGSKTPAHLMKDENSDQVADEFEIPTVFSRTDAARSRLTNMFLTGTPIFKTVSPPEHTSIAEQYDAVIEADSEKFAWAHHLSLCHLDGLKYDVMCAEVDWEILTVARSTRDSETNQVAINLQQVYGGNSIKRIQPSNAFWDTSVPLNEVHSRGDFAGYVEPYTLPRLLTLLHSLEYTPAEITKILFPTKAQQSNANYIDVVGGKVGLYQAPMVAANTPNVTPEQSAARFDLPDREISELLDSQEKAVNSQFEITKIYVRTIPAVLGFKSSAEEAVIPRLYKVLILNGVLPISIEETSYDHNYLPMIFSSTMQDGVGVTSKSFSHNLESLQKLANTLVKLDVSSSRRAVADRAVYNPHVIDSAQVNNPSATAKIPLKRSSPTADVRAAYQSIPYSDPALGTRMQQAFSLLGFADEVSGQNPVNQGQFVKGNKTNAQFQESMAASETRMLAMALGLHFSFYYPIKEVIKYNIAQYQTSENSYSQSLEKTVQINAEQLRSMLPGFKMADGLLTAARMLNTDALAMAVQIIPSVPEFQTEFNTPLMLMDWISSGEGVKMERYRYTREEKEARQAQMQEQMMAQAQAEAAANPEQQQQAPAQQPGMMQRMFGRG